MYKVEGYLWDLPEGIDTLQVKKLKFHVTDPAELAKLERIFSSYKSRDPTWVSPLSHVGGAHIKLSASGFVSKLTREAAALPTSKWTHRPARIMFKIRPYRFTGQNGVIVRGGSATLQMLEFLVY
jgi:hypothetical protein